MFKTKVLISLLLFFLLLNFILLFIYYNPSLLNTKSFIDSTGSYPRNSYEFKIKKGPLNLPGSKIYSMYAYILDKVYFDKNIKKFILPVKFITKKSRELKVNVIMGGSQHSISVLKTNQGVFPNIQNWETLYPESISNSIKIGSPIIMNILSLTENSVNIIEKQIENCNNACKLSLESSLTLSKNLEILTSSLKSEALIPNSLYVGEAESIILYD